MKISSRCYAVTGLGYSSPWCVNAGFIVGDEATLIVDTGANAYAGQTIHGYATAAKPGNRLTVINTEKHFDHIGGNGVFQRVGGEIWAHGVRRTAEEFQGELAEFNEGIVSTARRLAREEMAFFHGTELTNPSRVVEADMEFDLGGGCLARIVLTPGHTTTNISVWVPDDRVLFCGDCLISEYLPNLDAGSVPDWRIWLESLDRVEALRPEVVVAGHGPVVQGVEAVGQMIANVRRVLTESIARGYSPTAAITAASGSTPTSG
jgi:glyoxylase-like metal-dependent hydrolase (beta-lactamase superfamily II)